MEQTQLLMQGSTLTGEAPKNESERLLWSFTFRAREALHAMPGSMSKEEILVYFDALNNDLADTMSEVQRLKAEQDPAAPPIRVPLTVYRFNKLFNGPQLQNSSVSDIYEGVLYLFSALPSPSEADFFAGDLECVWTDRKFYWADILHEMNRTREENGQDPLVIDTVIYPNRLPGLESDPQYQRPGKRKARQQSPAPSDSPAPVPKTSRPRKKPKSTKIIANNDDEDANNDDEEQANDEDNRSRSKGGKGIPRIIDLDFLEKIPRIPLLCALQQAPFPCSACVASGSEVPCYVEFGQNPGCIKCRVIEKGCSLVPKQDGKVINEPHKSMLAYWFHGLQIIRLAKGLRLYESPPNYDGIKLHGKKPNMLKAYQPNIKLVTKNNKLLLGALAADWEEHWYGADYSIAAAAYTDSNHVLFRPDPFQSWPDDAESIIIPWLSRKLKNNNAYVLADLDIPKVILELSEPPKKKSSKKGAQP
ncbi:hypothetical protein K474DRAFT_1713612, partial [Panus rudis PR-1116 ss-1]